MDDDDELDRIISEELRDELPGVAGDVSDDAVSPRWDDAEELGD